MTGQFISTKAFAELVGTRERAGRLALKACAEGRTWRGGRLHVRLVPVPGGARGWAYEVAEDSIPPALLKLSQPSDIALSEAAESPLTAPVPAGECVTGQPVTCPAYPRSRVAGDHREATWRLQVVAAIRLAGERNTPERARAIAARAAEPVTDWKGRQRRLPERTLRDWIARYEGAGLHGLMRKAPSNAGKRRVHLSRAWDAALRAAGLDDDALAAVAGEVRKRIREEWTKGTPTWPTVQLNVLPFVLGLARKAGVTRPDAELHRLCRLPRKVVNAELRSALVAKRRQDAAGFAARVTPRIRRDRSHLRPGEWIAADVHHVDVFWRTPDGRVVTPKAVAWLDLATNRTRMDFFIMPKGEMIRSEHVIESAVGMFADHAWGVPSRYYFDNGGEYNWTDIANDLAKIKQAVDIRSWSDAEAELCGVQRAKPYNPQAKVIETLFAILERSVFSQLPGYVGGNRMAKKTANQGRAPEPYLGDEAQLRAALATALAYYHTKPQSRSSHLRGLSPNESFARFVAEGWTATVLDPGELAVAFSREHVRLVNTGGTLSLGGTEYRADELQSWVGHKVLVRQPMFGDRETLFVFTEYGQALGIARPERAYAFGDPAGAEEQRRRARVLDRDLRILATEAGPLASNGERAMAGVVEAFGAGPSPQAPAAVVRIAPEYSEAARMARHAPPVEPTPRPSKARAQFAAAQLIVERARRTV